MVAAAMPPAPRRSFDRRVEVAGQQYRVVRTDDLVAVSGGDPAAPHTMTTVRRHQAAAAKVTGCTMRAAYWDDRVFKGKLDCSARVIP